MIRSNDCLEPSLGFELPRRRKKKKLRGWDLFCGTGGSTLGIVCAAEEEGYETRMVCVNHNRSAIHNHSLNHNDALHLCTGVDRLSPRRVMGQQPVSFGWASPSCVMFSSLSNGRPLNPQDRAHAREFVKWIRETRPEFAAMENVQRFIGYGPCVQKCDATGRPLFVRAVVKGTKARYVVSDVPEDLRCRPAGMNVRTWWRLTGELGFLPFLIPDKKRLGEYFDEIIEDIRRCGYDVQWRLISAADHGAPTNRVRFFLQAVGLDTGKKIYWPDPTFARPDDDGRVPAGRLPWRGGRECLDLSVPGERLLGRKRALAANTLRRIAYGFINHALPEVLGKIPAFDGSVPVTLNLRGPSGVQSVELQVQPRPAPACGRPAPGLGSGFILPQQAAGEGATSLDVPFRTIATKGAEALVHAFLVNAAHGNDSERVEENFRRVRSLETPLGTVTGGNDWAVCSAFLVPNFGERSGQTPRTHSVSAPIPTVTSHGAGGLVTVMLAKALSDEQTRVTLSIGNDEYDVVLHYRLCRVRELARAQTFPEDFRFEGGTTDVLKQIGNAVPPVVARAIFAAYLKQSSNVGLPTGRLASTLRAAGALGLGGKSNAA